MEMSSVLHLVRTDVEALGRLGGPELEQAVERLVAPLEPVMRSRILDAVTQLAAELTTDLPEGRVETRLDGDSVTLAFVQDAEAPREAREDLDARITLRLPETLKARIEAAAARQGVSVNTWLLRQIERGSSTDTRGRRQLRGHGRS
jgi:predicted DNA binding CopG/RHH family protein